MMRWHGLLAGAAAVLAIRAAFAQIILAKLGNDLERLNAGDYRPLLAGFSDDAVLHFNVGPHRFSGPHRGKRDIERFLENFVNAGLQGKFGRLWVSGPPWALEICVRFDDTAYAPDGQQIYANRTVIWARTRWGKIVEQKDFHEDTGRILDLETELNELGVPAAT